LRRGSRLQLIFAPGAGKHYDIETKCAPLAHGKLDACVELSGGDDEMKAKLSIVRTDPFMNAKVSIVRTDPFTLKKRH